MYVLPFSFVLSAVASVVVCLRTRPEDEEVLDSFYLTVRPWGFWQPVLQRLRRKYPEMQRNRNFARDAFNVGIGIIWQLQLMVVPICIVIRQYKTLWISLAVLAVTSAVMKFTWYDKLGPGKMYLTETGNGTATKGT
jgi:hypothetical protein